MVFWRPVQGMWGPATEPPTPRMAVTSLGVCALSLLVSRPWPDHSFCIMPDRLYPALDIARYRKQWNLVNQSDINFRIIRILLIASSLQKKKKNKKGIKSLLTLIECSFKSPLRIIWMFNKSLFTSYVLCVGQVLVWKFYRYVMILNLYWSLSR